MLQSKGGFHDQLYGMSCVIVLIGNRTSGRKWIEYEIEKAWNDGKGLLGIYIHNLKDRNGNQSPKGTNPFYSFAGTSIGITSGSGGVLTQSRINPVQLTGSTLHPPSPECVRAVLSAPFGTCREYSEQFAEGRMDA